MWIQTGVDNAYDECMTGHVQCAFGRGVHTVQCTLYGVQCTVYSVQCTVYSV